jgi:hypothetical protein
MLKKLRYANRKKIKKAREVHETYKKLCNLIDTGKACNISVGTVRRYIALIEDIDKKKQEDDKSKYYRPDGVVEVIPEVVETIIEGEDFDTDTILANNVPDIKDVKSKILAGKLDSIALKYLNYLDDPSEAQLHRTSLKDRAVIAGILLDKKYQLQQKAADSVKNQSIIFNLFGDNKKLSEFITGSFKRQQALQLRPVKKHQEQAG